jgi:hypothetical protein
LTYNNLFIYFRGARPETELQNSALHQLNFCVICTFLRIRLPLSFVLPMPEISSCMGDARWVACCTSARLWWPNFTVMNEVVIISLVIAQWAGTLGTYILIRTATYSCFTWYTRCCLANVLPSVAPSYVATPLNVALDVKCRTTAAKCRNRRYMSQKIVCR